ncbi:helix-turn-helix domain-containing protein [Muricoccus radiodurans]|uniref:helix-turn-helix domain-containing protein n=1 Tax=Muricoccus radiodurans TaxID=2231721 RepID=UPI003CFAA89D
MSPEQCRQARVQLDWSATRLGKKAGISIHPIIDFERGRTRPRRETLAAILAAFKAAGVEFRNGTAVSQADAEPRQVERIRVGRGWPDPEAPGVPAKLEDDGFHWMRWPATRLWTMGYWSGVLARWTISYWGEIVPAGKMAHLEYVGPAEPPSDER